MIGDRLWTIVDSSPRCHGYGPRPPLFSLRSASEKSYSFFRVPKYLSGKLFNRVNLCRTRHQIDGLEELRWTRTVRLCTCLQSSPNWPLWYAVPNYVSFLDCFHP